MSEHEKSRADEAVAAAVAADDDARVKARMESMKTFFGMGQTPATVEEWQRAVGAWHSSDCATPPPPCPLDDLLPHMMRPGCTWSDEAPVHGLAVELRAARQELAVARAAIGEAWFFRPDDSIALALSRKCTALERQADGGDR